LSKQSSQFPDKETPSDRTSRGRKRKGDWVLWTFVRYKVFTHWRPRWKKYRSYRTFDEAERVLKKRQREVWWCYAQYRIAKAGNEPRDEWDEKWD